MFAMDTGPPCVDLVGTAFSRWGRWQIVVMDLVAPVAIVCALPLRWSVRVGRVGEVLVCVWEVELEEGGRVVGEGPRCKYGDVAHGNADGAG